MGSRYIAVIGGSTQRLFGWTIPDSPFSLGTSNEGVAATYNLAQYAYVPEGTTAVWALRNPPAGITIDSSTGLLSKASNVAQAALLNIEVSLSQDTAGYGEVHRVFTVSVNGVPVWSGSPTTRTVAAGDTYNFGQHASDPEVGTLTYSIATNPGGCTIVPSTGVVTFGSISGNISIRATDTGGLFAVSPLCVVTVTVNPSSADAGTSVETIALGLLASQVSGNYPQYGGEYGGAWRESSTSFSRPTVVLSPTFSGFRAFKMELPASTYTWNPITQTGTDNQRWRSGIEFVGGIVGQKVDGGTDVNNRTWEGTEVWGGVAVMLAADYPHPNDASWPAAGIGYPNVGFDLHTDTRDPDEFAGAAIALRASNVDNPGMWIVGSEQGSGDTVLTSYAADRGTWVRWRYNLVYSSKGLGRLKVWKNDNLVVNKLNVTTLKAGNRYTPYQKCQTYNGWIKSGQVNKTLPKLTVYTDEIRWAVGENRLEDVNPVRNTEYLGVVVSKFNNATVGALAFEADALNWNDIGDDQDADSHGVTVVSTPLRSTNSNRSLSAYIDQDVDPLNPTPLHLQERAEIRWGNPANIPLVQQTVNGTPNVYAANADVWFGWSTYVPSSWQSLYRMDNSATIYPIIQQWHHVRRISEGDTETNPWAGIEIAHTANVPDFRMFARRNVNVATTNETTYDYPPARTSLTLDAWTDFVVRCRMHPITGYFVVWKNTGSGFVKVYDTRTTGLGVGFSHLENTFHFKSGIYVPIWDNDIYAKNLAGNRVSTVQIYHAQYRVYFGNLGNDEALGIEYVRPR